MKKLSLCMIYLYFFTCPLEFILNAFVGTGVKYVAAATVGCVALYFISNRVVNIKIGAIQICLLLWAGLEAASVLWTRESSVTYDRLESYLLMAAFVLLLSVFPFSEKEFENILRFYMLGGLILALFTLTAGEMDGGYNQAERVTINVLGKYLDPNGLAANILGGACYSFYKIFSRGKYRYAFIPLFLIESAAIFNTGSRGALIALLLSVFAYVLVVIPKKKILPVLLALFAGLTAAYFLLKIALPSSLFDRLFNLEHYIGGGGRTALWSLALGEVPDHIIFGSGVASYLAFFNQEKGHEIALHNSFLCVVFEVGIAGFVVFITPFIAAINNSVKKHSGLILSILISNMTAAFFLDALYLRYIWNALIFGIIFYNLCRRSDEEKVLDQPEQFIKVNGGIVK